MEQSSCLICDNLGQLQRLEILPDNGVIVICVHDDTNFCKWVDYENFNDAFTMPKSASKHVKCPKCGNNGTVFHTAPNKIDKLNIHTIRYYVQHKGSQCYMSTQELRDEILKLLDRYISTPIVPIKRHKRSKS